VKVGLPPTHTEECNLGLDRAELFDIVFETLDRLNWSPRRSGKNTISASVSMSIGSWGEEIEVRLLPDGYVSVTSRCVFPLQWIDWGKNEANVTLLLLKLERIVGKIERRREDDFREDDRRDSRRRSRRSDDDRD
jgi:hypothetical protein